MTKLSTSDLLSLEQYARERHAYREQVMAHKKPRQIAIGPNARLYFEDETTIRYQIQEMLRIEKIFEPEGIQEELDTYNPLIPDGSNLKATFMLEYEDIEERQKMLAKLIGVERKVWIRVGEYAPIYPICDEDLSRDTEDKTSRRQRCLHHADGRHVCARTPCRSLPCIYVLHQLHEHSTKIHKQTTCMSALWFAGEAPDNQPARSACAADHGRRNRRFRLPWSAAHAAPAGCRAPRRRRTTACARGHAGTRSNCL